MKSKENYNYKAGSLASKVLILIMIAALCLLAGCSGKSQEEPASGESSGAALDLSTIKTIGDAYAIEGKDEFYQRAIYEGKYIYAFMIDGVAYRVVADIPDEITKKINDLEFDDDYDKNELALVADLPVVKAEDLTVYKLPQEELDKLVGKTGQELIDLGWRGGSFYNGETREAWLEYGPFAYSIIFDGETQDPGSDDFDDIEDLVEYKVVSATYEGMGDASYLD